MASPNKRSQTPKASGRKLSDKEVKKVSGGAEDIVITKPTDKGSTK